MVEEGLLRKSSLKKGDGIDELSNVGFKCNYDLNFVQDVAEKIDFKLDEFLFSQEEEAWDHKELCNV